MTSQVIDHMSWLVGEGLHATSNGGAIFELSSLMRRSNGAIVPDHRREHHHRRAQAYASMLKVQICEPDDSHAARDSSMLRGVWFLEILDQEKTSP